VAAAEAAVSNDALGSVPALLCVAADALRGHDCGFGCGRGALGDSVTEIRLGLRDVDRER
jgi:hypothetical protein